MNKLKQIYSDHFISSHTKQKCKKVANKKYKVHTCVLEVYAHM